MKESKPTASFHCEGPQGGGSGGPIIRIAPQPSGGGGPII